VNSRKVTLLNNQRKQFTAIVPFFDFFNHIFNNNDKWSYGFKAENKFFHVESFTSVKEGEEILLPYGHFSNLDLLLDYGFILDDEKADIVYVEPSFFGANPDDPLFDHKDPIVAQYKEKKSDKLFFSSGLSMSQELLEVVRVINAIDEDFTPEGTLKRQVDILTEFDCARWFQAIITYKLEQYPTSLKEDKELLSSENFNKLSNKSKISIKLRIGEKKILSSVLEYFTKRQQKIIELVKKSLKKDEKPHDEL